MMQLQCVLGLLLIASSVTTILALNFELSESDYSVRDDVLSVEVTSSGRHNGVTVQIISLAISVYVQQYPDQPCGAPEDILTGPNLAADSSDFNTTILERVVPPNTDGRLDSFTFEIALTPDDKLETSEVFLVLLNVTSDTDEVIEIARRCAIVRVQGSMNRDQEIITFGLETVFQDFELTEDAGTVFLFNVTKTVSTDLTITVSIGSRAVFGESDAIQDADFMFPMSSFSILPEVSSVPLNITIIDDSVVEDKESFLLTLTATVSGVTAPQTLEAIIRILDNEVVHLGFVGDVNRTVVAGEAVVVCADIVNTIPLSFARFTSDRFNVTTRDESATAGKDYTEVFGIFSPSSGKKCWTLQTLDNDKAQSSRYFTFSFASGQGDMNTVIQPSSVTVTITDNDPASIFQLSEDEPDSDVLSVEVTSSGPHGKVIVQVTPITLTLYTELYPSLPCGPAGDILGGHYEAGSSDFNTTVLETVVAPNTNGSAGSFRYKIALTPDDKLETSEVFLVLLDVISDTDEVVEITRRCGIGIIASSISEGQAVIQLEPSVQDLELPEQAGTVLLFNVVKIVDTELTITIGLEITSADETGPDAKLDVDFTFPSRSFSILPEDSSVPLYITVVDDDIAEDNETFLLTLRATVSGTPISQTFDTRITIIDNINISKVMTAPVLPPTRASPGLIAVAVTVLLILLLCCLFLFLFLCCCCFCWRRKNEKAYWPAREERKRSASPDSSYEGFDEDDKEYKSVLRSYRSNP